MGKLDERQQERRTAFKKLRAKFKRNIDFADALGDDFSPSFVSQLLGGHRGIGDDVADKVELKFPGWLDQEHGENGTGDNKYVMVPRLTVQAAAGNGIEADHVEIQESLAFRSEWLRRKRLKPEFLQVYTARGESMSPYIEDGDVILIDTEKTIPKSGEVWVIYQPTPIGVRIKRLLFAENGDMIIRSDNTDKGMYPDERVPAKIVHEVQVIGKLAWRGG